MLALVIKIQMLKMLSYKIEGTSIKHFWCIMPNITLITSKCIFCWSSTHYTIFITLLLQVSNRKYGMNRSNKDFSRLTIGMGRIWIGFWGLMLARNIKKNCKHKYCVILGHGFFPQGLKNKVCKIWVQNTKDWSLWASNLNC